MRSVRLTFATLVVLAVVTLLAPSAPAGAGGWAVASFDEIPELEAGVPVEVGFTVLQHGVHPASPESLGIDERADRVVKSPSRGVVDSDQHRVGVTVDVDGSTTFFPAEPSGASGHYVATVEVPEPGVVSLRAEMSWFGSSGAFDAEVGVPGGSRGGGWTSWGESPGWLVLAVMALGTACLAVVVVDLGGVRWRRGGDIAGAR